MADLVARLLDQAAASGVAVREVLPDEAFFAIAVVRRLQSRRMPFVVPAAIRRRKPRPGVEAVGLRARAGQYPQAQRIAGSRCG